MSHPRWSYLLVAALALQLSTVAPLWAQGDLSFTRQDVETSGPNSLTVGDFNGDGRQDLATADSFSVSILLGLGNGSFERGQVILVGDINVMNAVFGITAGDFDGDGQQDLATLNQAGNSHSVTILRGRGDGTFDPPRAIGIGVGTISLSFTAGDFNGDGRPDLATVSAFGVTVLLGRGDGTFEIGEAFGAPTSGLSITTGEFNGDGRQDLVTGDTVFVGNGDGTFERVQTFGTELAFQVVVGDFNGDRRQDLATANTNADSVSILLGRGDGTFESPQDFEAGNALSLTVGDFNGDGQQDLAATKLGPPPVNAGSVVILPGQGDATFQVALELAVGRSPDRVTVGDFNGDGQQDLATANREGNSVSILINRGSAPTTYRLTRIGDETFSPIISDINETGEMVGSTRGIGEPRRAIRVRDGRVSTVDDLAGGAAPAAATAINDSGWIIGTNELPDASGNLVTRGFLWIEFVNVADLGVDPGAVPLDINSQGQIVGFSVSAENLARPFFWQCTACPEGGRTTFLEALVCLGNPGGIARAINDSGVIVGSSNSPGGTRAVMWRNGGMGGITPLEPPFELETGEAVDVNDRGAAIGFYFNSSGPQMHTALLWQADDVTVLPPLDHPEANAATPESINNQGHIVGHTHLGSGRSIATLWRGSAVLDLNTLVSDDDPAKGFVTLAFATRITDSGLIVASGVDSRDSEPRNNVFFLLRPAGVAASSAAVPPPSTASPPPSASSPSTSDDRGGGAVDLVSLLLLLIVMSASAECARRTRWRPLRSACRLKE